MNKLDYADMRLEGRGNLNEIFQEIGKFDVEQEIEQAESESTSQVDMKATTIRLPAELLDSYDAVLKHFGLSRQQTFAYMVHDFIASSITGYLTGRMQAYGEEGVTSGGKNYQEFYADEWRGLVEAIPAPDKVKEKIRSISSNAVFKHLEGEY